MFFQIRPAGGGAPLIDPKPILDGWVALQDTSIFGARGENPFLATSPTVGQVLLESKQQLQQLLARDQSIHMRLCERQDVQTGKVGRPVLAALEYLSVSGLKPTVSGLRCAGAAPASEGNASARSGRQFKIIAINGVPIAGHQGLGSIADATIRKLLMLEGLNRPRRIVSLTSIPGTTSTFVKPSAGAYIKIAFGSHGTGVGGGGGACGDGARFGADSERVGQADRATGGDPRPDGLQRSLAGGDPRHAQRRRRSSRWQRLARPALQPPRPLRAIP